MDLIDKIFGEGTAENKRAWKTLQKRGKALPTEFAAAYKAIQQYMLNQGTSDWTLYAEILDLFELAVLDGQELKELIGEDVATFVDEMIDKSSRPDGKEKYRQALNDYFARQ